MKIKRGDCGRELLPEPFLREMAETLGVLGHVERLRILEFLADGNAAPVHRIVDCLKRPQAVVSHHLVKMRQVGVLSATRCGQEVEYRVANRHAITILDCMRRKEQEL
jgi:DNA-binding transcriptional ArsR family regulator